MLNKEVVFILGAGASVPYDFPDGRQLLKEIKKSLSDDHVIYSQNFGQDNGFAFRQHLELSGTSSIDEFLTNNPEHDAIGRFVIARMLMAKENPNYLMNPE